MATLTGSTIATTYKTLMKGGTNNPVVLASDNSDSERVVFGEDDGADVRTDLYLTRNRVGINDATPGTFIGIDCDKGNESFNNYGIYIHGDKGNNTWNSMLALGAATSSSAATQRRLSQSYLANGTSPGPLSINESGGNVGIGTTTPTALLQIDQTDSAVALRVQQDTAADIINVFDASIEVFTILDGGNVGIGATTPVSTCEIQDGLTTTGAVLTLGTKEPDVVASDVLGRINFYAPLEASGTDAIMSGASIHALATDTFAADNNETALVFSTASSDAEYGSPTSGALFEHLRITSAGKVGIGTSTPGFPLDMYGADSGGAIARIWNDGEDVGAFGLIIQAGLADGSTGTETSYLLARDGDGGPIGSLGHDTSGNFVINATSDARLKKDIADTKINGLGIVNAIKLREFTKIKGGQFDKAGFIAQELKEVWSQAVGGTEDDVDEVGDMKPMTVSYPSLIPPLVKAIQELSAKITALENA